MLTQQRKEFAFKISFGVVLQLALDIAHHFRFLGATDREGPVTVLTVEFQSGVARLIDVFAGVGLQYSNEISNCNLSWNANQNVSVIEVAANLDGMSAKVLADTCHVAPSVFAKFVVA